MAHIKVDRNRCEGHGICADVAPTHFELTDDGELRILTADVTPDDLSAARSGVDVCPVRALSVLE